jgi:predicted patatin/cPLA2 family phospholipase
MSHEERKLGYNSRMSQRVVLYISGGTMRGIFGAGVVTALEEADVYDVVEAVYGSSSGALIAAYFLAKETRLGSSIFYEDLTHDFISVRGFWGGIVDRIVDHYLFHIPEYRVRDALDLDYLFRVVERVKPLKVDKVIESGIPLWVKLFDLSDRKIRYERLTHDDPMALLRASTTLVPYVHRPMHLKGHDLGDPGIIEPIGFAELRRRHPDSTIVVIMSADATSKPSAWLKNHIEGFFARIMYGRSFYGLFAHASTLLRGELDTIAQDPNAILVANPPNSPTVSRTRHPKKLKTTYEMGLAEGRSLAARLRR